MRTSSVPVLAMLVALLTSRAALAQPPKPEGQRGQLGLSVMYPGAIGLTYHVTDRVALRGDAGFARATNDYTNPGVHIVTTTTTFSVGLSALFYVRSWEDLRLYVAPRVSYGQARYQIGAVGYASPTVGGSGSIGAQYLFARRFGVFAEAGVAYAHTSSSQDGSTISTTWSSRASLGATLYF